MLNMTARITARPGYSTAGSCPAAGPAVATKDQQKHVNLTNHPLKVIKLDLATGSRDGYLYVPPTYNKGLASPLLVMLHGAGGHGKNTLATFGELSVFDEERCLLLVPESRGRTWDMIRGGFGPDVDYINKSLAYVFDRYNVDPNRLGVAGFSDGASYALSLGLPNGNLFSHIIAFSPGFMRPPSVVGKPKIYISHGVYDDVLSIDYCSRSIVPRLRQMLPHAEMHYVEFNGAHVVRADISKAALDWFLGGAPVDESTYSQNEQGSS